MHEIWTVDARCSSVRRPGRVRRVVSAITIMAFLSTVVHCHHLSRDVGTDGGGTARIAAAAPHDSDGCVLCDRLGGALHMALATPHQAVLHGHAVRSLRQSPQSTWNVVDEHSRAPPIA